MGSRGRWTCLRSWRAQFSNPCVDQSLARGRGREQLEGKLSALAVHGLHGVAYVSHACFVLVGKNRALAKKAFEVLKTESRLPESRFVKSEPLGGRLHVVSATGLAGE